MGGVVRTLVASGVALAVAACGGSSGDFAGAAAPRPVIAAAATPQFKQMVTLGSVSGHSVDLRDAPQQVQAGDFNGDGRIDFLVTFVRGDGTQASRYCLMINQGNGQWADQTEAFFAGPPPLVYWAPRVAVADFNGDGRSDVYLPEFGADNPTYPAGHDQLWLSGADGKFTVTTRAQLGMSHGVSVGDINRDGHLDVVIDDLLLEKYGPNVDRVLMNDGRGGLVDNQSLLPPALRSGAGGRLSHTWSSVADVTGDGWPDLILGTWEGAVAPTGPTQVYFSPPSQLLINDGTGNFASSAILQLPQSPITPEAVVQIEPLDVNGDGLNDLLLSVTQGGAIGSSGYYGTGYLQILVNQGGGKFVDETAARYPQQVVGAPGAWWKFIRVADFNQDGAPDLLLTGAGYGAFTYKQSARVLLNDGQGRFSEALTVPEPTMATDVATVADVNGDGFPDLVGVRWTSMTTMELVALLNDSVTAQPSAPAGGAPLRPGHIAADAAGIATAVYSGPRANYTLARTDTGFVVRDNVGADGVDTLLSVRRLQFADSRVAIDIDGHAGEAYRLYQAAFDRTPDAGGVGYWMAALGRGALLTQVADAFIGSPEFSQRYGNLGTNDFVIQLYQNVLHRAPDSGGVNFWASHLTAGDMTRAQVLAAFSESAENQKQVKPAIRNGFVYTP